MNGQKLNSRIFKIQMREKDLWKQLLLRLKRPVEKKTKKEKN